MPRLKLHITDVPLEEHVRLAGQGTPDQIHRGLEALEELGADHILFSDNPASTANPESDWMTLRYLAEQVIDLEGGPLQEHCVLKQVPLSIKNRMVRGREE